MSITKEQFLAYESVRESGVTNMFDSKLVKMMMMKKTGEMISKEGLMEIMLNYNKLKEKYGVK